MFRSVPVHVLNFNARDVMGVRGQKLGVHQFAHPIGKLNHRYGCKINMEQTAKLWEGNMEQMGKRRAGCATVAEHCHGPICGIANDTVVIARPLVAQFRKPPLSI